MRERVREKGYVRVRERVSKGENIILSPTCPDVPSLSLTTLSHHSLSLTRPYVPSLSLTTLSHHSLSLALPHVPSLSLSHPLTTHSHFSLSLSTTLSRILKRQYD